MAENLLRKVHAVAEFANLADFQIRDPMSAFGDTEGKWSERSSCLAVLKVKGSFEVAWDLGH